MNYIGNLIIWNGSYKTNSNLPIYDKTHMLQWDEYDFDFNILKQTLLDLKSKGYYFNNAIIRSNGESVFTPIGTAIGIKETLTNNKIYDNIIFDTNGTLFHPSYFYLHEYYKDILCSVERISFDKEINKEFYQYSIDDNIEFYEDFPNFSKYPLRINFIYTNKTNLSYLIDDIDKFINIYNNVTHINIQIPKIYGMKINSNNLLDNKASSWIVENFCTIEQYNELFSLLDTITFKNRLIFFNRYEWNYKNIIITCDYPMTNVQIRYGKDFIYYNNKLYNYAEQEIVI